MMPPQGRRAGPVRHPANRRLHLGNLLGAILRWVRMQDEAECLFFLADLHALTVDVEPDELRSNVREMAAALIASGIDPAKSILFPQSAVPAHAELAWILQCTARVGWLNRMTQFKDKSGRTAKARASACITYPVLQAADILLYAPPTCRSARTRSSMSSSTRDIAIKFNTDYDVDLFVPPEPFIGGGTAARVMSLRDGTVENVQVRSLDMSRINLTDSDDEIAQKIRKAKTDPEPLPDDAAGTRRPAGSEEPRRHLRRVTEQTSSRSRAIRRTGFGVFKPALADALVALIGPIRARLEGLRREPVELDRILADGAGRASAIGAPVLARTKSAVGLTD